LGAAVFVNDDEGLVVQSLIEVLSLLRRVRSLQFDAWSESSPGWDGIGRGTVAVSEPTVGVVIFDEAGTWQPIIAGRAAVEFKNIYRWSEAGEALRLEHLRFGADHPVLLFDMAPGENGMWREVSPHHCGEDCYTASHGVEGGQLVVASTIDGPRKREFSRYTC